MDERERALTGPEHCQPGDRREGNRLVSGSGQFRHIKWHPDVGPVRVVGLVIIPSRVMHCDQRAWREPGPEEIEIPAGPVVRAVTVDKEEINRSVPLSGGVRRLLGNNVAPRLETLRTERMTHARPSARTSAGEPRRPLTCIEEFRARQCLVLNSREEERP